jgi:iron-sulfur cluster assembly protein
MTALMNITENAAKRIKYLLEQKQPNAYALLVSVKSGGCSGLKYDIEYVDTVENAPAKAAKIDDHGITVYIDPLAVMYLLGSTMDYKETLTSSGFEFENPNKKTSCGCGESFSV